MSEAADELGWSIGEWIPGRPPGDPPPTGPGTPGPDTVKIMKVDREHRTITVEPACDWCEGTLRTGHESDCPVGGRG